MNVPSPEQGADLQVREVRRITWIGMIANILLAGFKIIAGGIGHSQAVVADGVHTISDCATDLVVLVGVGYWTAPPDQNHPYGHRRIETLVTAFIGLALALAAVGVGYHALTSLKVEHSRTPDVIALAAALVSILTKEILYHWNVRVGKRVISPAVIANAWHHRADGFSSVPVALAVGGAMFLPGWYFLDQIGAVLVSLFILRAAWKIGWPALMELADLGADPEVCEEIERISVDTGGVLEVHKCRTRHVGYGLQVDLHVLVKPDLTVREGHRISGKVKHRLMEKMPQVVDVIIHLEPVEEEPPASGREKP